MNKIKYFLLYWVWQFPQMALGRFLSKILTARKRLVEINGRVFAYYHFERNSWFSKLISGVSLGTFILLAVL